MEYLVHILIICSIYAILALGLDLLVGYTGLPILGHAAFFCVGAYTSALLSLNWGLSPWLGLVAAMAASAATGLLVAYPCIRLRGDFLALTTFGLAIVVYNVANNWESVTRGPLGLPGIPPLVIHGLPVRSGWPFLAVAATLTVFSGLVMWRIAASPFGRVLRAIRDDDVIVAAVGRDVARFKMAVLCVAAAFAGLAGALYADYISYIAPSSFTVMESVLILLMVVLGGMGTLTGSVLGAVMLIAVPEALRFLGLPSSVAAPMRQAIYGLALVLLMQRRPQGILGKYVLGEGQ